MASVLTVKPVNVQVRYRGQFVPPKYDLYKLEVSAPLATRLAETYSLKSTNIIVNQGAASTQYFYFRHFLPGEPFRYIDVYIGLDQVEMVFSNPATIAELIEEFGRVFEIITEKLAPVIKGTFFEATLHCETEGSSVQAFLNEMVQASADATGIRKGFSIGTNFGEDAVKLNLEISDFVPNALYVAFALASKSILSDTTSRLQQFNLILAAYRKLQDIAAIEILERNADGTFTKRN
jgi:hypothetical protein